MPSTSEKQAIAARIALAAKKKKIPVSKLKGASRQMFKGMSEQQLTEFTKVAKKGNPSRFADMKADYA